MAGRSTNYLGVLAMATTQPTNLRAIARSIERLTALCDALEVLSELQSNPDMSSYGWRILQRVALQLRREIRLESEID